jgi:hypothetical protein
VLVAGSYTHTAVACPSWRSALVGSLMAGNLPAWLSALGVTRTPWRPAAGASAPSSATLTWKVRVTGSALAATSRTGPPAALAARPAAHRHVLAGRHGGHLVFGHGKHHIARAVLRNAHHGRAGRHHLARLGSMPVTTPATSATSVRVGRLVALRGQLRRAWSSVACAALRWRRAAPARRR